MLGESIGNSDARILITSFPQLLLCVDLMLDEGMTFLAEVKSVTTSLTTQAITLQNLPLWRRFSAEMKPPRIEPRSQRNQTSCRCRRITSWPGTGTCRYTGWLLESKISSTHAGKMNCGYKVVKFSPWIWNYQCLQFWFWTALPLPTTDSGTSAAFVHFLLYLFHFGLVLLVPQ